MDEKSQKSATLRETNRKCLVTEQKNNNLVAEIAAMEKSVTELRRRLEVKDGVITRHVGSLLNLAGLYVTRAPCTIWSQINIPP